MITFKQLWENHPTITRKGNPCDSSLEDQCAMKLGTAFYKSGIKIHGVEQCWFVGHKGQGHYLRAEELANGLRRSIIPGLQPVREFSGRNFKAHILGTTGIIFLKDYWRRKNPITKKPESFRNRSGDHIDLWNGSRLTNWRSWARIHVRFGSFGMHSIPIFDVSDFEDSKSIWFWRVL